MSTVDHNPHIRCNYDQLLYAVHSWSSPRVRHNDAKAEVIAFTGCASEQTSADVGDVGQQFQLQAVGGANAGGGDLMF